MNKALQAYGERTAIEDNGGKTSFASLRSAADNITRFLLDQSLPPSAVIGISLRRRPDLIAAIIGIINARAVFVLLDDTWPERRMEAVTRNMQLSGILTSRTAPWPFDSGVTDWCLEELPLFAGNEHNSLQYPQWEEDDSLYIYFTSGSTGTPKGILGRNASLLQFMHWEAAAFNIKPGIRISQFISPYFDAFLRDIFIPLLNGGTICVPPAEADFFTPEKLIPWVESAGIELIHCVPSLFRVLNHPSLAAHNLPVLKYVLLSGEKIIPSELKPWYDRFYNRIQLVNLYGPSETTLIRSCYLIQPEDASAGRIPIGGPIADTTFLVLDPDLQPCLPLVAGDLYIVSDYMTKGYLDPAQNNEKFIQLTLPDGTEKRAFRTGDKARVLSGGLLDLLGREDRMVKISGIRIELDEIENVLNRSELVSQAVVINREEDNGTASLVAFIVPADGGMESNALLQAVRAHMQQYLPAYMMPADLRELPVFPLLSNGKVDYRALETISRSGNIVAPENEVEEGLLAIWKEILGDKLISTEDSFHKIGGNSLSIMKLIGRIYKGYSIRISLSDLFSHLTIKKQAEYILRSRKDNLYVVHKAAEKPAYHVTQAQERLYYQQQLHPGSVAYNMPMAWEIRTNIEPEQLEAAFAALISRHEILRTSFVLENGELFQVVKDNIDFRLQRLECTLQELPATVRAFNAPFNLAAAPLLRAGVFTTPENKKILAVNVHHIVCDGMSQMILFAELLRLCRQEQLPALERQYKDYAEWEYNFRSTEEYITHREFWLRSFENGIPRLALPTLNISIDPAADRGDTVAFEIDKAALQPLLELLNAEGITVFTGLYALYFLFLSQLTGQEDLVIGIANSGRMQHELEGVVGMFVKTLPVRCQLDPYMSFEQLLKEMGKLLIQANSKQVYDLANIVTELNTSGALQTDRLFDVMFVYQDVEEEVQGQGEAAFARYPLENSAAKYPLTLFAVDNGRAFGFKLEYLSAYFTAADITLLIAQFTSLAERAAAQPFARIIDLVGNGEPATRLIDEDISFNF